MNYIVSLKPFHKLMLALILLSAAVFGVLSQASSNQLSDTQPVADELMAAGSGTLGRCSWGTGSCPS